MFFNIQKHTNNSFFITKRVFERPAAIPNSRGIYTTLKGRKVGRIGAFFGYILSFITNGIVGTKTLNLARDRKVHLIATSKHFEEYFQERTQHFEKVEKVWFSTYKPKGQF